MMIIPTLALLGLLLVAAGGLYLLMGEPGDALMLLGFVFVVIVIFMPDGLVPGVRRLWARWKARGAAPVEDRRAIEVFLHENEATTRRPEDGLLSV